MIQLSRTDDRQRSGVGGHGAALVLLAVAILVLSTLYVANRALDAFNRELLPLMDREAEAVSNSIGATIERALALGVPPDQLVGVPEFFEEFRRQLPGLGYIALVDGQGRLLHGVGPELAAFESLLAQDRVFRPDPRMVTVDDGTGDDKASRSTSTTLGEIRDTTWPIVVKADVPLVLHVGSSGRTYEAEIADVRWDVWIVLLVSVLATYEILVFLMARSIIGPMELLTRATRDLAAGSWTRTVAVVGADESRQLLGAVNLAVRTVNEAYARLLWKAEEIAREGRVAGERISRELEALRAGLSFAPGDLGRITALPGAVVARTPLFIFVFAEQLPTSFMPLYAKSLYTPLSWLDPAIAIGLPLSAFVAAVAIATPFGGWWVGRHGSRSVFLAGAVPAVAGHVLCGLADSLGMLIVGRIVTAIGYALVTIACQHHLVRVAASGRKAGSLAVFVLAVVSGTICGMAIGAVLADRVGFTNTFLAAAGLAALAAGLAGAVLPARTSGDPEAAARPAVRRQNSWSLALHSPRFLAIVLLAAIPAKIGLNGLVYYLAPLYLTEAGVTLPAVGRTIMMYSIGMLVAIHAGAWLADRRHLYLLPMVLMGLAASVGALLLPVLGLEIGMLVAVAALGLGHGIGSAPMLAAVPALCDGPDRSARSALLLGFLRSGERFGSMAGPMIAASLVAGAGPQTAAIWLGFIPGAAAILLALFAFLSPGRALVPKEREPLP
ncbi:MAG TPA: MFS transporter [Geminicoccus sp.]|jgi:predicted MFS family arabinose efflux permease/HAMP domain-containing protein|uniref:MFS transporter n=1 Tax=Geminicoccus sp. TaxID=2024832 RepID=UPI002E31D548|nr:MFS transporter [Geminicoccus sp.]HEX2525899.1 MFS transporter [Geminicoccus sp.]